MQKIAECQDYQEHVNWKDGLCIHFGVHTGKCWLGGVPDRECRWRGRRQRPGDNTP